MKLALILLLAGAAGLATTLGSSRAAGREGGEVQTSYYANGQVLSETSIRDGEKDGPFRRYYADGTPMAEGRYRDGAPQGAWTWWNPDGSVDRERSGVFEDGVRVAGVPAVPGDPGGTSSSGS